MNNDEIKEISEFINASAKRKNTNSFNECEMNSQAIMDLIFAKTDKIQEELDQFNSNRTGGKELNDREESKQVITERNTESSRRSRSYMKEDLNDREDVDPNDSELYVTPEQERQLSEYHNTQTEDDEDHQSHPQNGLNVSNEEELDILTEEEENREYGTNAPPRTHITNGLLETVGEATIEETTKQDITTDAKYMSYEAPNQQDET